MLTPSASVVLADGAADAAAALPPSAWNILSKAAEQWPFFVLLVGAAIALWIWVLLPYLKQRALDRAAEFERVEKSRKDAADAEERELGLRLKIAETQTAMTIELAKLGESLRRSVDRHEAAVEKFTAHAERG